MCTDTFNISNNINILPDYADYGHCIWLTQYKEE